MGRRRKTVSEPRGARAASRAPSLDPLVACARTWIAERDAADALMDEWRRLESALIAKHGGMTTAEAVRRGHPEGRTMQDLERRCDALDRKLDRDAARIAKTRAKTAEGVIAKIELGLEIQSPFDRDECSWALIESGCEDLRGLIPKTRRDSAASGSDARERNRPPIDSEDFADPLSEQAGISVLQGREQKRPICSLGLNTLLPIPICQRAAGQKSQWRKQ